MFLLIRHFCPSAALGWHSVPSAMTFASCDPWAVDRLLLSLLGALFLQLSTDALQGTLVKWPFAIRYLQKLQRVRMPGQFSIRRFLS